MGPAICLLCSLGRQQQCGPHNNAELAGIYEQTWLYWCSYIGAQHTKKSPELEFSICVSWMHKQVVERFGNIVLDSQSQEMFANLSLCMSLYDYDLHQDV